MKKGRRDLFFACRSASPSCFLISQHPSSNVHTRLFGNGFNSALGSTIRTSKNLIIYRGIGAMFTDICFTLLTPYSIQHQTYLINYHIIQGLTHGGIMQGGDRFKRKEKEQRKEGEDNYPKPTIPTVEMESLRATISQPIEQIKSLKPSELLALLDFPAGSNERKKAIEFLKQENHLKKLEVEYLDPGPRWGHRELYDMLVNKAIEVSGVGLAFNVVQKMNGAGVKPTTFMFNAIFMALDKDKGIDKPDHLLTSMKKMLTRPNAVTYSILLTSSMKKNNKASARQIRQMLRQEKDMKWDGKLLNVCVSVYGHFWGFTKALELILKEVGSEIPLTLETFGRLFTSATKDTDSEHVVKALSLMDDLDIEPDLFIQKRLAEFLASQSKLQEALSVLEEIWQRGENSTQRALWFMINASMKTRNIEGVYYIMDRMKERDITPFRSVFNDLINMFANEGKMDDIHNALEKMKEFNVAPNVRTWTSVLKGYIRSGDLTKGEEILETMQEEGLKPDVFFFNTMLTPLGANAMEHEAKRVTELMAQYNLNPDNVTLQILINLYRKLGNTNTVEYLRKQLTTEDSNDNNTDDNKNNKNKKNNNNDRKNEETLGDVRSLTELVKSQMAQGKFQDAMGVVDKVLAMSQENVRLDNIALTALLQVIAQGGGEASKAEELFDKATKGRNRIKADVMTFNALIAVFSKQGNLSKALSVLPQLQEAKVVPNLHTYLHVLKACQAKKQVKTAFDVYMWMKKEGMKLEGDDAFFRLFLLATGPEVKQQDSAKWVEEIENQMQQMGVTPKSNFQAKIDAFKKSVVPQPQTKKK